MILKPDDILQVGDLIHFDTGEVQAMTEGSIGLDLPVRELSKTAIPFVERPDPAPDLAEQVRILREMLEITTKELEAWEALYPQLYAIHDKNVAKNARAALAATKGDSHE
jgi:hypothetical protein